MQQQDEKIRVTVNLKNYDEHELQYVVSRKLTGIINLAENSGRVRL